MKAVKHILVSAMFLLCWTQHDSAACEPFNMQGDWEIWKCEELTDDSKYFIAYSDKAKVRQESEFPYNDNMYFLEYQCGSHASHLSIFVAGGVNLSRSYGKLKLDRSAPYTKRMTESTSHILFDMSPSEWESIIQSERLRLWLPYHRGDAIVDFSLTNFIKAAKQLSILNSCRHSDLDEILESQVASE